MDEEKKGVASQEAKNGDRELTRKQRRVRNVATIVYLDSVDPEYIENLRLQHVRALLSPIHDKDLNKDGSPKKPHRHLMLMFDGVQTEDQVRDVFTQVLGQNCSKHLEVIKSVRGYARYLTHMDDPDKAQYDATDVIAIAGVDYASLIATDSDAADAAMWAEIYSYWREHRYEPDMLYFSAFMDFCFVSHHDWWVYLSDKKAYVLSIIMKSEMARQRDRYEVRDGQLIDPESGEVLRG